MGLWEKHSPTYSNMHLVKFSIHLSIVFTRLTFKKTKYTYDPQTPNTQKIGLWSFSDDRASQEWQEWEPIPHSLFFNHSINHSSFLELPSFSKKVMLKSVRKAFWENWLGFLGLFQSIQDELACINEALNAVHKTGLSPTVQLWPRLVHALLLLRTKYRIMKRTWEERGGNFLPKGNKLHLKTVSDMLIIVHIWQQLTLWWVIFYSLTSNFCNNSME